MTTPEEATQIIENLIGNAHKEMYFQMEQALRRIAKLPWYMKWQSGMIAQQTIGTGPYWSGTPGVGNSISPKNTWQYLLGFGHSRASFRESIRKWLRF